MDHINFCSSCCPTTAKKDLLATTANESSAMKDEANGSSTTPDKPKESPVQIKKKSELEGFLKESKKKPNQLIVLNFTTTWCKPCINAEKPFMKLKKEFTDVNFANVDVDHFLDLVNYLDVVKMPTFLLMKPIQSSNKGSKNVPKGNNANGVEGNMGKEDASEGSKNVPKGNNANGVEGNMGKEDASEGSKNVPKGNNANGVEGRGGKEAKYDYKGKKSQIDNFKEIIGTRVVGMRNDLEGLKTEIQKHLA